MSQDDISTISAHIKNWDKFQHFKDRKPPWIKLYRDLLNDMDWHSLDGDSAKMLVMFWLLASESKDGALPSFEKIAFRFRVKETLVKSTINKLCHWLDINVISERYQCDAPETETETETETDVCINSGESIRANGTDFERFWKYWPVKRNKQKAKTAFKNKKFTTSDVDLLITDVERRKKKDKQWSRGFVPHCSTYLNGNRWEDEYGD